MTDEAVIAVQIVDMGNDPRHKGYIRIIGHVPAEQGKILADVLGWPTYTNPVPVALAPLDVEKVKQETKNPYLIRAGKLAKDKEFWAYAGVKTEEDAAQYIRNECNVMSRRNILPGSVAASYFDILEENFNYVLQPKEGEKK